MSKIPSKKEYLRAVAQKLNHPTTQRLLQFGQTWNKNASPIRDRLGMMNTQQTVLTSAANMYDMTAGRVAFSQQLTNFSAGATYEDVSNVRTVGAIDLTILAMSQSLVPFLCIDRGMTATDDTIYYNNLVAVNDHGAYKAGDTVWGNFNPPPTGLDLSNKGTATITYTPDSENGFYGYIKQDGTVVLNEVANGQGAALIPRSVMGTAYRDIDGTQVAFAKIYSSEAVGDMDPVTGKPVSGAIMFARIGGAQENVPSGSINYKTGDFSFGGGIASKFELTFEYDAGATQTATEGDVLIVEPQWTALPLHSTPHNIILQNNLMNMMYMSKVNALATGTAGNPYTDAIFQRVRNTYIESINAMVIRGMVNSVSRIDVLMQADGYGLATAGYQAVTKNDLVCQTVANMKAAMLAKSGCGMTAIVANSVAVAMMETVPVFFVKNPNINAGLNGLVGYFMDIPVYRHNSLDRFSRTFKASLWTPGSTAAEDTYADYTVSGTDAVMFGAYRTADNTSGSQVYGEYLPFTNTGNVGNYAMPVQQASGFFSMVANKVIDPRLITLAVISGNRNMYGWADNDPVSPANM